MTATAKGALSPSSCPPWCAGSRWHDAEQVLEEVVSHGRSVAHGWMPAAERVPGEVTFPHRGWWDVTVETDQDRTIPRPPATDAHVVVAVNGDDRGSTTLRLLSGEALQLAEALQRAGRLLTFED